MKKSVEYLMNDSKIKLNVSQKRGQVTIFIVLAIIIVAVLLVYFLWLRPSSDSPEGAQLNFEGCVEDVVGDSLEKLGKQGGFANPEAYYEFRTDKVAYLCYTNEPYSPCQNQVPLIIDNFKGELERDIKEGVQSCYQRSINELKSRGFSILNSTGEVKTNMNLGKVEVIFNAPTSISGVSNFKEFRIEVNSYFYEMLSLAHNIVNQDMELGDSDIDALMRLYRDYKILKYRQEDKTSVYKIENMDTNEILQFATRSYPY